MSGGLNWEQMEEFARVYLQNDALVYRLPNVIHASHHGTQKANPSEPEKARQKVQRRAMCKKLGIRNHQSILMNKIRAFQVTLYDEVCKRVRTRLMRGAPAASALEDAPPSVRRAANALQLLPFALKNEAKQLSKEGAATAIVDSMCAAWEGAGRCAACGARAGGGCGDCRSEGAPPRAVLRAAARQFDVEDVEALKRLWSQYREGALHKLRALAAGGDDLRRVPVQARPTATDWRVIDLTLLYDDGVKLLTDSSVVHHEQLQPLIVLFSLVQQHGLERGEQQPWRDAHRQARDRGSCVSLVVLQRRWHELCLAARGAVLRAMHCAGRPPPLPPLYQALVRRFPEVATRPLMSWRELVAAGRVYTDFARATDFGTSKWPPATSRRAAPAENDKDDLIIVEKDIETIELRESDGESDELIIHEDDKSLAALAQDKQHRQHTIRKEIQNHRELLRNNTDNLHETDLVKQSNVAVSAMDIDNANVGEASVSNTQNYGNTLAGNENIVNFSVGNLMLRVLNTDNADLGNVATGSFITNEGASTSSLNCLDTGQNLSILNKINPESSEAMIIFEDDDDESDTGLPSGDNNSGDEISDNDRCNNAGGDSAHTEDMPVNSLNEESDSNNEAVIESQDPNNTNSQIVESINSDRCDNSNHDSNTGDIPAEIKNQKENTKKELLESQGTECSINKKIESDDVDQPTGDKNGVDRDYADHDLNTENISNEIKSEDDNTNKEEATQKQNKQNTEDSGNQIVESNYSDEPSSDKNIMDQSNDANHNLHVEDIPAENKNQEENTNKELLAESKDTECSRNKIIESDDVDQSTGDKNEVNCDNVKHDLNTENNSDDIESEDDNTNKEVATQKQDTEDSGNQVVESNYLGELGSDKNSVDQSNDANHDLHTEDLPTESKNQEENASKKTVVESQEPEFSRNQIIESDNGVQPTGDKNYVDFNIGSHDVHMEDSETQNVVSKNIPDDSKNTETATKSKETEDSSSQIVESNDKELIQNFRVVNKGIMEYKRELKLEIDNNLEVGDSEANSANFVGGQLATDILRQHLSKDRCTTSEDIPKIDNVISIASVETKSENEVSNDSTGNSNDTEMVDDSNVVETSENNETDAMESNSEADSASTMDTTDLTPGVIDPKLLMTPRIPLTRVDSPLPKPSPKPLLVEDFSTHPDYNVRMQGLSDSYLVKNWHLLRLCRPLSVHVERMPSGLLDRYLGGGRRARRVLLPDIEEVRRANRRLLTAQVAPTPLPSISLDSDDGEETEQPPPQVEEVIEEASMPTEEELMNLLQRCEPPALRGNGSHKAYCCLARRHRAHNDARARLAARAGKRAPEEQDIHGARHNPSRCDCCCLHLLPGATHATLLARLARHRRRLEHSANVLLHRNTEQCDDDDDDDCDLDDVDVAIKNKAAKRTNKKRDKRPSEEKEKEPENTEQPTSNDDYSEWIRQKNLANKYFHIQAFGDETHKTKHANTDTAHKHTEATTEHNQPIRTKTQTPIQNKYVPRVFGSNLNKDEHTSAAKEPVAIESNNKIVSYSGNSGQTVVKMCRATAGAASCGNRKRKSLEDVADTPSKISIRIPTQFDKISIDDSEIVNQIMKNDVQKRNVNITPTEQSKNKNPPQLFNESTSQTANASVSLEDPVNPFGCAKNTGVVDNINKTKQQLELFNFSDSDDDFVDRLFIDETAQKLDRTESQYSDFDKLKDGWLEVYNHSEANTDGEKGTGPNTENAVTKINTVISKDVPPTEDTINETSQTKILPNEDAETGAQGDRSDETSELKLLPSKKVYQKVLRPKLVSSNTSSNIQIDEIKATCDKNDDINFVGPTTENVNKDLLNESFKTSPTDSNETQSKPSETRKDEDSDDDVQILETTPAQAKTNARSLLKNDVRVTAKGRPLTILEQIAQMHEKGQKFIIQKVIDNETTPVVYKSGTKVSQISRYIGLVPETNPRTGQSQAKLVPGQPIARPVVNLNAQLANIRPPPAALAKPLTHKTVTPSVITIKQLAPTTSLSIVPTLQPIKPKPNLILNPMPLTKVTDGTNKSKYPIQIARHANTVATKQATTDKVSAINAITVKTPYSNHVIKIGNTTIVKAPKAKVNEINNKIEVTPSKPAIKECIPVLTLDAKKESIPLLTLDAKKEHIPVLTLDAATNALKANVNNTNQISPKSDAKESTPMLTLDASTVPDATLNINASGLVLKVCPGGLVMSKGNDMATITAVGSNDNVANVGSIDNVVGDGSIDNDDVNDDVVNVDGGFEAMPIISNVKSLAAPAAATNTIYMKSVSTQSGGCTAGREAGGAALPAVSAREFVRGRDPTDITVLCVDAARPLMHLKGGHLVVTELELPCARAQYWTPAGGRARRLAFDAHRTDSEPDQPSPAPPGAGGLKVRSFARMPADDAPAAEPTAAPDRVRSEGKVYKKLCDHPLVYAKVLFVCSTISWCRRALSSSAWVGLRAPTGDVHAIQRAAAPAAPAPPSPRATPAPAASAGLRCDEALPALTDLVQRLNGLNKKVVETSDVISIDSDGESE